MGWYRQFIEAKDASLRRWFSGPPGALRCKVCGQFTALGRLKTHMRVHFAMIRLIDGTESRGRLSNHADPRDALSGTGP